MGHIVVGIDGSDGSRAALGFAAAEAKLRGDTLRAVAAWHVPAPLYAGSGFLPATSDEALRDAAREAAEQELRELLAGAGVEADLVVREGNAAHVLIEASQGATMLVVGSRGHGGFAGLLLGSVSQQCAAHAACPVAIVHDHSG